MHHTTSGKERRLNTHLYGGLGGQIRMRLERVYMFSVVEILKLRRFNIPWWENAIIEGAPAWWGYCSNDKYQEV